MHDDIDPGATREALIAEFLQVLEEYGVLERGIASSMPVGVEPTDLPDRWSHISELCDRRDARRAALLRLFTERL